MKLYREMEESILEVSNDINETQEYKQRLNKLIENFFDRSTLEQDITGLIDITEDIENAD